MLIPQELQLSLSQKDHSLCKKLQDLFEKVGRAFRKLQSLFERYTTAFIIALNFHISFINRGLALF